MAGTSWSANTASSIIVPYDKNRESLLIDNHEASANNVYIQRDQDAEANKGTELTPGDSFRVEGKEAKRAWYAITASGTAGGGYQEGF